VLFLERAFEGRHESGSLKASLIAEFHQAHPIHIWLNTVCLAAALFSYNVLSVVRKYLPNDVLVRMLLTPIPDNPAQPSSSDP
jgi:hypothetical protein